MSPISIKSEFQRSSKLNKKMPLIRSNKAVDRREDRRDDRKEDRIDNRIDRREDRYLVLISILSCKVWIF